MREIKFRGINLQSFQFERLVIPMGIFIYGSFSHVHDVEGNPSIIPLNDNRFISVDAKTVGQFTGLKDKNGKEIYEGDLCRSEVIDVGKIIWMDEYAKYGVLCIKSRSVMCLDCTFPLSNYFHDRDLNKFEPNIEIIGNVYENPELLTSNKPHKS